MRRLFEKKEDQIRKQTELSDEEKDIIIKFFSLHPEQDKKCKEFGIDWNRIDNTADKFFNLINSFNERFLPKLTLSDLKEGEDYVYLGEDSYYNYYFILSYKGSVTIASNNVEPEVWTENFGLGYDRAISFDDNSMRDYPIKTLENGKVLKGGAKWCISTNHSDAHWEDYIFGVDNGGWGYYFIFACMKRSIKNIEDRYKKVAIQLDSEKEFNYLFDMFDACDYSWSNPPFTEDFGYEAWGHYGTDADIIFCIQQFVKLKKQEIGKLERKFNKMYNKEH